MRGADASAARAVDATGAARSDLGIYAGLVVMAVCWGGAFIGGRIASTEFAPAMAALLRFAIATVALVLAAFVLERGLPRLTGGQWLAVAILGATGVLLFNLFFMYGLARTSAARGALIMAVNPAITLLGAVLFLHERLTRDKVAGIALALVGVAVVLGHGNPANLLRGSAGVGELLLFGCPVCWAAYTLVARRLLPGFSAIAVTTYAALLGTAMLALVTAAIGELAPPVATARGWAAVLFVGLFGTALAFVLFYRGVRAIGPARTAVFINLVPVAAIALGVLILDEPLESSMLAGAALVIAGVLLLNRPTPPRAAPAPLPT